jgi:hypothetical protein
MQSQALAIYVSLDVTPRLDRSGGAFITCFSIFLNRRYSGGFLMSLALSSALSFWFGSDLTPPPDWLGYSRLGVSLPRLLTRVQSAPRPLLCARYSGTIARQGI